MREERRLARRHALRQLVGTATVTTLLAGSVLLLVMPFRLPFRLRFWLAALGIAVALILALLIRLKPRD